MTNVATSDVHAALTRAADQLLQAGGPDGIVSRKDIRTKLLSLEGTERELVDALYRFIDRRDGARSARMTKTDIDAALAFIRTDLVDRHDLDKNGLAEDEVARMSDLGKLAVSLARKLKEATGPSGEALAQKIASLAAGLYLDDFGSEGGMGFSPFHAAAKLTQLTKDTFRAALEFTDRPEHDIVRFEPADRCLEKFIATHWDENQQQAEEVVRFMKANLREICAVVTGRDDPELGAEHPTYIVGIDSAGNLVGLKTAVIWT
jgi:Nuclease A inhibitor-like protein